MKIRIAFILLIIVFCLNDLKAWQSSELQRVAYFDAIEDVHPFGKDSLAVVSNNGNYHLRLFPIMYPEEKYQTIRNGRGPGEVLKAEASALDSYSSSRQLYLKGNSGKIIKYDIDRNQVIAERTTKMAGISHMQVFEKELILSKRLIIRAYQLDMVKNGSGSIAYILNKENFEVLDTLSIPLNMLGLGDIEKTERLNNQQSFHLNTFVLKISEENYLVGVEGLNKIFILSNNQTEKIDLARELPYYIEIIDHPEFGMGIKTPGIINNVVAINKERSSYSFSFGQPGSGITSGIITLSKERKGFSVTKREFPDAKHQDLTYNIHVVQNKDRVFFFGKAIGFSSELFMMNQR